MRERPWRAPEAKACKPGWCFAGWKLSPLISILTAVISMTDSVDVHPRQLGTEFEPITKYDLLRAALQYATNGTPVFPCCPWDGAFLSHEGEPIKAKAPLTKHGFKGATTDQVQIIKWWGQYRFAMIGRMVPLDQICIDLDPWKGGDLGET
jgi:hypothetical protein